MVGCRSHTNLHLLAATTNYTTSHYMLLNRALNHHNHEKQLTYTHRIVAEEAICRQPRHVEFPCTGTFLLCDALEDHFPTSRHGVRRLRAPQWRYHPGRSPLKRKARAHSGWSVSPGQSGLRSQQASIHFSKRVCTYLMTFQRRSLTLTNEDMNWNFIIPVISQVKKKHTRWG